MPEIPNTLLENINRITKQFEHELNLKKQIHDILSEIASSIGKQQKGVENVVKNTETMKKIVDDISDEIVIESVLAAKTRNLLEKTTSLFSRSVNNLSNNSKKLNTLAIRTLNQAEKHDRFFSMVFENLSSMGGKLGKLFAVMAFAVKQVENNIDIYRRLIMAGVQVEGGLLEMRQMFKDIGFYTTDAIEMLINNASLINRLTRKNLVEFEEAVDENIMNLVELGIPYNEIKKWSISYLAAQRNLGKLRELTMQEQANTFNETLREFYRSAQWLGISVSDFVSEYKKLTQEPRTRTALQTLPEHSRNLITFLNKVLPSELASTITDAVLLGSVERTNEYVDLTVAGLTPFVRRLIEMINEPTTTIDDLVREIKSLPVETEQIQRLYIAGLDKSAKMLADVALTKRKIADQLTEVLTDEEKNASLTRTWMKNVTQMRIKLFDLQSELLKRANEILKKYPNLGEAVVKALDVINNFINSKIFNIIEFTFKTFASIFSTLKNIFDFIFSPLGIPDFVSSLATGGLLYGLGKSLRKMLGKSMTSSVIAPVLKNALKGIFNLAAIVLKSKYGKLAAAAGLIGYAAKELWNSFGNDEKINQEPNVPNIAPPQPPTFPPPNVPVAPPVPSPKPVINTPINPQTQSNINFDKLGVVVEEMNETDMTRRTESLIKELNESYDILKNTVGETHNYMLSITRKFEEDLNDLKRAIER